MASLGRHSAPLRVDEIDISASLGSLILKNPIVSASGCFGSGQEINQFFDVSMLGAVICKSVTFEPRLGLPTPRMVETASGMLNAIGLQNPGIERWMSEDLPWLRNHGVSTIVSLAGGTVREYRLLTEMLRGCSGIIAIEANISCPNVEDRHTVFASKVDATHAVIQAITRIADVPVFAKLTPDVTDICAIAQSAIAGGVSGVSLINTPLGMAIDAEQRRPRLAAVTGGLSGPAIKPLALRAVYDVHTAFPDLPIIGVGGVTSVSDVVEMMLAGASAVAVGTATFGNPMVISELINELPRWLAARGYSSAQALIGGLIL